MKNEFVIGVVGGMGSYATLDFFGKLLDTFPAEKEWDRPRVIIDNRCTMPSRVLAYLYGEKKTELVAQLYDSIRGLVDMRASRVVLACNTSHLFLEEVYKIDESLRNYVVDIIECCKSKVCADQEVKKVYLLATEGTIDSCIYQDMFKDTNTLILSPSREQYTEMREMIEAVKQNRINKQIEDKFLAVIEGCGCASVILGCTEFPVIYSRVKEKIDSKKIKVFDPLVAVLDYLYEEYTKSK